jgi:hypothetical protein
MPQDTNFRTHRKVRDWENPDFLQKIRGCTF